MATNEPRYGKSNEGPHRKSDPVAHVHGRSGDYIEVRAKLISVGKSSRKFECTAHKVIEAVGPEDSAANLLSEPILVVKATGVAVVPLEKQRLGAR